MENRHVQALPIEIWQEISVWLPAHSYFRLLATCRYFSQLSRKASLRLSALRQSFAVHPRSSLATLYLMRNRVLLHRKDCRNLEAFAYLCHSEMLWPLLLDSIDYFLTDCRLESLPLSCCDNALFKAAAEHNRLDILHLLLLLDPAWMIDPCTDRNYALRMASFKGHLEI
ncbi:hypothetical protein HDU91_003973, partial [Kappamyces sp. JEL0680]